MSTEKKHGDHEVVIIVNGTEVEYGEKTITYERVLQIAFGSPNSGNNIVYTVTYSRGHGHGGSKSMVAGDEVKVTNRMVFNATPTNRS